MSSVEEPQYDEKETARRRDAALAKMLATPPQPRQGKQKPSPAKRKAKKPGA
jgi:hypothetical protein